MTTNTTIKLGAPVWKARAYTGAGIILTRTDGPVPRILCLRGRATGIWSFSKGHPENVDGGKPLRTAARETYEETGLVAGDDYKIIGSSVRYGKRPYWMGILEEGVANQVRVARKEHDVAAWFSLEEIRQLRGNTDVRAWVKKAESTFMQMLASAAIASAAPSITSASAAPSITSASAAPSLSIGPKH
jgi:8-oxo-dGTP pyrophosphatase MutT (NUDIX family)